MQSTTFYTTYFNDSDEYCVYMPSKEESLNPDFDPLSWVCYNVAKTIAFEDCTDETVQQIFCEGIELKYSGWQPGMVYEFYNAANREIVWCASFPSWEH